MSVFEYASYKVYLRDVIESSGRRGLISEIARAAGCAHSYLSQVLSGKPDLTPDQAWALNDYFAHSKEEADYFLTLVLMGRASSPKLKKALEMKLKSLRSEQLRLSRAVEKSSDAVIDATMRDRYYGQWWIGAIHALTACEDYQTVEDISKRLTLSPLETEIALKWLVENKLVRRSGQRYVHSGQSPHLPTEAIHNQTNHLNWRLRATLGYSNPENVYYTSAFSISKDDWDKIRAQLIFFIESQRAKIQSSGSDEVYAFCCDLFRV